MAETRQEAVEFGNELNEVIERHLNKNVLTYAEIAGQMAISLHWVTQQSLHMAMMLAEQQASKQNATEQ